MSKPATPKLEVVPDAEPETSPEPEATLEPAPPPPPPAAVSIQTQITRYARLVTQLKRDTHLNEGTLVRLIELALNERFTLIQMGMARPNTAPALEATDDSQDPS